MVIALAVMIGALFVPHKPQRKHNIDPVVPVRPTRPPVYPPAEQAKATEDSDEVSRLQRMINDATEKRQGLHSEAAYIKSKVKWLEDKIADGGSDPKAKADLQLWRDRLAGAESELQKVTLEQESLFEQLNSVMGKGPPSSVDSSAEDSASQADEADPQRQRQGLMSEAAYTRSKIKWIENSLLDERYTVMDRKKMEQDLSLWRERLAMTEQEIESIKTP